MTEQVVLYGVDALTSKDFRAHVLTEHRGRGGTILAVCGVSHRKWRPVSEFARPEVFTECAGCMS